MSFYTVHIHDIFNHNTSYNGISFKVLLSMSAGQFTHLVSSSYRHCRHYSRSQMVCTMDISIERSKFELGKFTLIHGSSLSPFTVYPFKHFCNKEIICNLPHTEF